MGTPSFGKPSMARTQSQNHWLDLQISRYGDVFFICLLTRLLDEEIANLVKHFALYS